MKGNRARKPMFDPLAPVEDGVDPLDAFMIGLTSDMSTREKKALSGHTKKEILEDEPAKVYSVIIYQ